MYKYIVNSKPAVNVSFLYIVQYTVLILVDNNVIRHKNKTIK